MGELKISSNMKKGIKAIERLTEHRFKGKSFEEAQKFLDEYLPEIRDMDIRTTMEPSEKMWKAIRFIESFCDVSYEGSNMKDASDFIGEYLDKAKALSERSRHGKN